MKTCALCLSVYFISLFPLHATTWYVSNSGSNSNSGLSPASAFLTIQFAENQCDPGDSVLVANGNYAGFYVNVSGTSVAPIVFLANGSAVSITSPTTTTDGINVEGVENNTVDYIEINGFIVNNMPRNGIRLVYANNCIVRNCTCIGNDQRGILTGWTDDILIESNECAYTIDEHGIYVSNSSDRSVIRYNSCHHNHGGGIQINADGTLPGDGISSDPEIYGNVLYENALNNGGGAAINLDGVQGAFIYNNLLYENHATGIALFQIDGDAPSINATVLFNTIVQASNGRSAILITNGATGAQVHNNIIINQHAFRASLAVSADAFVGLMSDYNIVINSFSDDAGGNFMDFEEWQDLGYDLNSTLADPLDEIFIDEDGEDYHLLSTSQAVDAANAGFSSGIDEDIEENPRPVGSAFDIGAYEEQSVVLALEEEEHSRGSRKSWWLSSELHSDRIIIHGLVAGDDVSIVDVAGRQRHAVQNLETNTHEIHIQGWIPGMYVLCVSRGNEILGVRTFVIKK